MKGLWVQFVVPFAIEAVFIKNSACVSCRFYLDDYVSYFLVWLFVRFVGFIHRPVTGLVYLFVRLVTKYVFSPNFSVWGVL